MEIAFNHLPRSLHSQNPAPGEAPIPGIQGWNSSECGAHETTCTAFPCLADVLEEQVRALEDETSSLCLSPPLLLSVSSSPEKGLEDSFEATSRSNEHIKFAQIPALRVSTFDNAQHQMMIPVNSLSTMFCAAREGECSQRGLPFQKAFSPTLSGPNRNPIKPSKQGAPLAAALYNADCVRQGLNKSGPLSWSGCLVSPWCTLPPASHLSSSSCNSEATVPGLAAYLPEELAALDLPVGAELPSKGLLPPKAAKLVSAYLKERNGTLFGSRETEETEESPNGKTTSVGKPVFAMDRFPAYFQGDKDVGVGIGTGIGVADELDLSDNSSNTGDETVLPTNVVRGLPTDIESGMSKSSIVENTRLDEEEEEEEEEEDDDDDDDRGQNQNQNQQANSSLALGLRKCRGTKDVKTDLGRTSARTTRRNVLHPASNGKVWTSDRLAQKRKAAASTAGASRTGGRVDLIAQKHKKVRKNGARYKANSQNLPLLVLLEEEEEESWDVQARASTVEPVSTRRKATKVSSSAGAQSQKKGSQRSMLARRGQQWITNQATDPRTGQVLSSVPPATFCTQCGATSTPVWRAGPFGHKTLCNACGVRWMKVAPKSTRR